MIKIQHVKKIVTCNQGRGRAYLGFQKGFKSNLMQMYSLPLFQRAVVSSGFQSFKDTCTNLTPLPSPRDAQSQSSRWTHQISFSFSQRTQGHVFYLCIRIHGLELKFRDGLPHSLLHPHPHVLYNGQRVIHRANGDVERLGHLEWQPHAG